MAKSTDDPRKAPAQAKVKTLEPRPVQPKPVKLKTTGRDRFKK